MEDKPSNSLSWLLVIIGQFVDVIYMIWMNSCMR